jgi:hypothetical protein
MQSDFRRLMSEIYENTHKVVVHDPNLDSEINSENSKVSPHKETDEGPYIFDGEEFELFQQMASAYDDDSWEEYKDPMDEISTSSVAGAYNASLHASPKQYKGPELEETSNPQSGNAAPFGSGYKAVKGFKAGHTKDKGGFQYKDLWGVNEREETEKEEFKIGDKVEIVGKWPDKSYGQVISFDDDLVAVNVTKGGGSTFVRKMMIPHNQLRLQNSEIKKQEKKEKKKEMEKEPIKEGLKTEIKVRSKKQQFQEATKMANKKLKEINSILEFAQGLKTDLQEVECDSCSRMMENMKHNIAEAYKKMKTL